MSTASHFEEELPMESKIEKNLMCNPIDPNFWKEYSIKISSGDSGRGYLKGECWDKAASTYDDLESCEDYMKQVNTVLGDLKQKGALSPENTVLDVACGTGTYAVRMAPLCREVVALDVSQAMLKQLRQKQEKLGIKNIRTIHADWNSFQIQEKFDLVFVSMTPILRSLDNLDRFLEISKKYLAVICWAGIRENPLLNRLYDEILGERPDKQRTDIVVLFNYLYARGYAPDLKFFHGCWERTRSVEGQIKGLIWQLEMARELTPAEREQVRKRVAEQAQNGLVRVYTKVRIGFMLLDKEAGKAPCPPESSLIGNPSI